MTQTVNISNILSKIFVIYIIAKLFRDWIFPVVLDEQHLFFNDDWDHPRARHPLNDPRTFTLDSLFNESMDPRTSMGDLEEKGPG